MGDQQPPSWTLALQLERALRGSAKKQMGFWSSSTRALRAALLQAYEAVLFEDYTFAQVRHDCPSLFSPLILPSKHDMHVLELC